MTSKKRDLEIVYSLRWKNDPKRDDRKEMSIVVVYDIPSTTLNFEVFKNYLLKNSGIPENDVCVYYIMDNGKEYPIQSQTDFQVALYSFRRKARVGEVINLVLERVSDQPRHKNLRHSNDVETQIEELQSMASTCCNAEAPPEWFISGLAQLKKEIKDEMLEIVTGALAEIKMSTLPAPPPAHCSHRPRNKPEKRLRKATPIFPECVSDAKDFMKSLKLENKLDKLERKASKYREKRLALQHNNHKSSDSEAGGHSSSRSHSRDKDDRKTEHEPKMDAKPVNIQSSIPHMLGGEVYLHQWDVQNSGETSWTSSTQLQYTWGSKKLVPLEKVILVPYLKPGERGTISARFQIPTQSGKYECYWQFSHKGRRFGHWLGLQVIVDSFDLKGHASVLETTPSFNDDSKKSAQALADLYEFIQDETNKAKDESGDSDYSWNSKPKLLCSSSSVEGESKDEFFIVPVPQCFVRSSPENKEPEPLEKVNEASSELDNNNNNNDDNVSGAASSGNNSIKLRDEELDNIVVITVPKDEQVKEGFIYVHVDGQKVLIPKNILKSEVVNAAQELEKSPTPSASIGVIIDSNDSGNKSPTLSTASTNITALMDANLQQLQSSSPPTCSKQSSGNVVDSGSQSVAVDLSTTTRDNILIEEGMDRSNYFEANNYMSHCSAAGSCFSEVNGAETQNRMFVFPQDVPGYEVVYPVLDPLTSDLFLEAPRPHAEPNQIPPVPNYQQTPVELRRAPVESGSDPLTTQQQQQSQRQPPSSNPTAPPQTSPTLAAQPVQILPEGLVNGAVSVARSVVNMIMPQAPGTWVNGHWVSSSPETPREANLQALAEMGFWNRDLNATLLARFNDDLNRVVAELVQ